LPRFPKEKIPVFKNHFEKGDFKAREVACRALWGVGPSPIPMLAKYLDDKNSDLCAEAAQSLATRSWLAARAKERGEKVAIPVSLDEFFAKLKRLHKLPDVSRPLTCKILLDLILRFRSNDPTWGLQLFSGCFGNRRLPHLRLHDG
jgi:hypothetical protein